MQHSVKNRLQRHKYTHTHATHIRTRTRAHTHTHTHTRTHTRLPKHTPHSHSHSLIFPLSYFHVTPFHIITYSSNTISLWHHLNTITKTFEEKNQHQVIWIALLEQWRITYCENGSYGMWRAISRKSVWPCSNVTFPPFLCFFFFSLVLIYSANVTFARVNYAPFRKL